MKHPILLALAFLTLAGFSTAQSTPSADFSVGYSPLFIPKGYTIWMNGGRGTAAVNVNNWFGIAGDVSVYVSHVPETITGETYMAGPRFTLRKLPFATPFVQALFGGSHFSESTGGITGGGNQFAFSINGGTDIGLGGSQKFALRLQGGYLGIRSDGAMTPGVTLGVGIVYRVGTK